jgi:hypothetical protein
VGSGPNACSYSCTCEKTGYFQCTTTCPSFDAGAPIEASDG